MIETVIGSFSRAAVVASSGDCDGVRMVAKTLYPARPKASAACKPIPLLVPVISTDGIFASPAVNTPRGIVPRIRAYFAIGAAQRTTENGFYYTGNCSCIHPGASILGSVVSSI